MAGLVLRLVQISDTHITKGGGFVEEMMDKAIHLINHLDPAPDIVIHSGDLTDNGVLADYKLASEKLASLEPRVLVAPGNHDEKNYGQSLFKELVGPMDYNVGLESADFIILNSPEPDRDEGRLGRRRQNYLESILKTGNREVLKVVVFHHHLVPVPLSGREVNVLGDAGDVLDLVLREGADLVLMGHRHVRRVIQIYNTIFINSGTTSSLRTRGRLGHSFNIIDIDSDGEVRVTEKNLSLDKEILLFRSRGRNSDKDL